MSKLHLVFGGKVKDPRGLEFVDLDSIDLVGLFENYAEAEEAWRGKAQRTVDQEEVSPLKPATLPSDIDRAVQVIEHADAQQLGDAASEMLRRMLPFLLAVCRRLNVELPLDKITQALRNRPK